MAGEHSIVLQHYSEGVSFDRSFDYEMINKQRRLYLSSRLALTGGFVALIGSVAGFTCMMAIYNWHPGWVIPMGLATGIGLCCAFSVWSDRLQAKADAIKVAPIYSYNIGNNVSVSAVGIGISAKKHKINKMGVGISLAAKF